MFVNTKAIAIRRCPLHKLFVVILEDHPKTLWVPLFVRESDARLLDALLRRKATGKAVALKRVLHKLGAEILHVTLHSIRRRPFLAKIRTRRGDRVKDIVENYVDAIALAIQANVPIRIAEEFMFEVPGDSGSDDSNERSIAAGSVIQMKIRQRLLSGVEKLEQELQQVIEREDFEQAEIIRQELDLLRTKSR